jgi:hypothetical protein
MTGLAVFPADGVYVWERRARTDIAPSMVTSRRAPGEEKGQGQFKYMLRSRETQGGCEEVMAASSATAMYGRRASSWSSSPSAREGTSRLLPQGIEYRVRKSGRTRL